MLRRCHAWRLIAVGNAAWTGDRVGKDSINRRARLEDHDRRSPWASRGVVVEVVQLSPVLPVKRLIVCIVGMAAMAAACTGPEYADTYPDDFVESFVGNVPLPPQLRAADSQHGVHGPTSS